jgi:hypothetical protein
MPSSYRRDSDRRDSPNWLHRISDVGSAIQNSIGAIFAIGALLGVIGGSSWWLGFRESRLPEVVSSQDQPVTVFPTEPVSAPAPAVDDQIQVIAEMRRTRNCQQCDLSGANLSGMDLRNVNLTAADLRSANLRKANLSGAKLLAAKFNAADLSGANLSGTNFGGANLSGAIVRKARLRGTNLTMAQLGGADFTGSSTSSANMDHAWIRGAIMPNGKECLKFCSAFN